jgi:hypothetical protein
VAFVRHDGRYRVRVAAWLLAGLTGLVLVSALVLAGLNAGAGQVGAKQLGIYAVVAVAVGLYGGSGRLIASRLPANAIGWLLCLIGLSLAVSALAEQYALYGLATAPGTMPAARWVGWLSGTAAVLTIVLLSLLVLLFPDGRLPSRRWRPVLWAILVVGTGWVAAQMQAGTSVSGGLADALEAAGASYPNPLGIFPRHGWFSGLIAVNFRLALVTAVLVVASVFVRRRGAGTERRKQLAWLGYVGLMTAGWAMALIAASALTGGASSGPDFVFWNLMVLTPVAGIPLACVVAVLKYRLYEIDRIISRTLAYAIVTGLLVAVYTGLVLLATRVLPRHGSVAVAGSTLAAAALFTPLRSRVQRMVDRRFNRARYDADETVAAFAARLKDAVDLDSVHNDLASVVHHVLEPAHVSIWISERR